jgi:alpha-glucosidase
VPTWWDETRVVDGRIGEYLVTARRKGRTWHLGALSGGPAREVDIPLSFLGRGAYRLRLWSDAPETAQDPNRLARTTRTVRSGDRLAVRIAADGGFVAEIAPEGGAPAGLRGR